MSNINEKSIVKTQYANSCNLNTRISIHDKYSTNKTGFANWIFSLYEIPEGAKILELGCGTGSMWNGHRDVIDRCSELVLSDFSEGMLEAARETVGEYENVLYKTIDIQDIPFEANTFDVVIANMMLYHVPDIFRALSEVRRVLKSGGKFYSATFGEHGIIEYLSKLFGKFGVENRMNKNFTLQNGTEILSKAFTSVTKEIYEDSLAVTNVQDMVDYIYSLSSMTVLSSVPQSEIKLMLEKKMSGGVLMVPKEYGMFISCGGK